MSPHGPPLNETSTQILIEKDDLQGALICGVAYGAGIPLYLMTLWHLWHKRSGTMLRKYALMAFVLSLAILASISYASNSEFTQLAFITNRNIDGGPGEYEEVAFSIPVDNLGSVCSILSTWLCDGLLVWRFHIIFTGIGVPSLAMLAFPGVLWLGTLAMGILFILQCSANSPWVNGGNVNWTIPFFSLSLGLNILLTVAIALRLIIFRRHIVSVLGKGHGSQYTSIAAMIVESAALFSIFSILFIVPFALNNPLNNIFVQSLNHVQVIATILIIFRVAQGKSWDTGTAQQEVVSTVRFATGLQTSGNVSSSNDTASVGVIRRKHDVSAKDAAFVDFEKMGIESTDDMLRVNEFPVTGDSSSGSAIDTGPAQSSMEKL